MLQLSAVARTFIRDLVGPYSPLSYLLRIESWIRSPAWAQRSESALSVRS